MAVDAGDCPIAAAGCFPSGPERMKTGYRCTVLCSNQLKMMTDGSET